ncbi:MAG: HesA/MoeB/ThiF family protein [Betaproteobacteria bacterium]|jgi:molybdopterin/thiamine biosynthesis adenylyltransferase
MDDQQLLRYSRHILLDGFGVEAQEKLAASTVLVVGAGGLASGVLPFLASAGVGKLLIADGDTVDLTNLQRQIIHRESSIGHNKASSAKQSLAAINSSIEITAIETRLDAASLARMVETVDLVVDCTDNFVTRHAINAACVLSKTPLVSGAAIRCDGQLMTFDFKSEHSPCYACVFPDSPDAVEAEEDRCGVMGVFAPLVGVIGASQAADALKMLTGFGELSVGRLRLFSAATMTWREVRVRRDTGCRVCGTSPLTLARPEQESYA